MHLLVIEDERALCETIVRSLRRLAYSVDYCYDGEKALELLGVERYDLVLLDLNLPKKDGMTVLRTLRQTDRETRVLILSDRSEVEDKVQGLDAGANDYLPKPFHLAELEARIRSLTLRQFTQQDVLLSCGGLTFDTRSRTATVNGQTLTLTRKETGILEYLMVHQGRPVSQEELMDHVWDNSVMRHCRERRFMLPRLPSDSPRRCGCGWGHSPARRGAFCAGRRCGREWNC